MGIVFFVFLMASDVIALILSRECLSIVVLGMNYKDNTFI